MHAPRPAEQAQDYAKQDGERFLDAVQNARLVANAERYYRIMYYGSRASWNLRDGHMFETLKTLLAFHGPASKAIVWAHNSHVGDSAATEMAARGEYNIGQLCRKEYGNAAYSSASGPMAVRRRGFRLGWSDGDQNRPPVAARRATSACAMKRASAVLACPARPLPRGVLPGLLPPRLERAIGVIYRPEDRACRVTISRRCCRTNSTNISGSTKAAP